MTDFLTRNLVIPAAILLSAVGCSQILGLGDYEIADPPGAGGAVAQGGDSGSGTSGETGGEAGSAGEQGGAGGAGGASGGEIVPCDSANCCEAEGGTPVGVELLSDGGFELGPVLDGNSPWKETSVKGYPLITDGVLEKVNPHGGDYFAFLAGLPSEDSDLDSPTINVPANTGWMVVSGYRWFQVDSLLATNEDFCGIALYDPASASGDALEIPFFWDSSDPGETTRWTRFEESWDAAPHAGKKRYFKLRGSTDAFADAPASLAASNYLFDDISLQAFVCEK